MIDKLIKYIRNEHYFYKRPVVYLNLTYKCPLRCKYCYVDYNKSDDFTYDDIDKIMEQGILKNPYIKMVSFFGGEPTLKLDIIEKILKKYYNKMSEMGKHFALITSLTINTEKVLELVNKYPLFELVISFDKFSASRTDKNGNLFNISDIIENYNFTDVQKNNICIHTVINNQDSIKNLFYLADFYKTNGVLYSLCWDKTPQNDFDLSEYKNYILYILDQKQFIPNQIIKEFESYYKRNNISCSIGSDLFVSKSGLISPCSISHHNYFNVMTDGKIMEDTFEEIDTQRLNNFNNSKCFDCYISGFCNGGCLLERKMNRDDFSLPNPIQCELNKKIFTIYQELDNELSQDIKNYIDNLIFHRFIHHIDYCHNTSINITMEDMKKGIIC